MASKKTVFNLEWTDEKLNPQWSKWIEQVQTDPNKARCRLCMKSFNLSNMGRQAITSHEKSTKHQKMCENSKQSSLITYFRNGKKIDSSAEQEAANFNCKDDLVKETISTTSSMLNYVSKEESLRAEILWAMKIVMSHSSFNSFKDVSAIFREMFLDSTIAKNVSLGSTKIKYLITYGLAPYFHSLLIKEISSSPFVICFDESLNTVAQKGQMDLIIRYWPEDSSEVKIRYLTSVFLGHSTAEDLFNEFCKGTAELDLQNLLQISMDGPHVNHKFWRHLYDELKEHKNMRLLNIGTCSLHVIHGAFQSGNKITDWNLNSLLSAMHKLFKDSPARRADFIEFTGTHKFPLKFCQVRWVENVKVAERALEVFPFVKQYVESAQNKLPQTVTAENILIACKDKLIYAKISFFISIASVLEPFLKAYQSPSPMVPFLYNAISDMLRRIMSRFVKAEVLREAATPFKLVKIDMTSVKSLKRIDDIDIGIAARSYIKKSGASEADKNKFLLECRNFLITMTKKIVEKSPVNFSSVRMMSCLDPNLISSNNIVCERRMTELLEMLLESNFLPALAADRAKDQFSLFISKVNCDWKKDFLSFTANDTKLDVFFHQFLNEKEEFKDIWKVIKMVMTISHGNASVESGFSINKDILVENLHEKSLVAIRTAYDAIKSCGGPLDVKITADLLLSAKLSRSRYFLALEENKIAVEKEEKREAERKRALDQIKILQQKRARLTTEAELEGKRIEEEISELKRKII